MILHHRSLEDEDVPAPSSTGQEQEGLSLNDASALELQRRVNGIGRVLAERIVAFRESHGPFESVEDLRMVSGIGTQNFARIAEQLVVTRLESTIPPPASSHSYPASSQGHSTSTRPRMLATQGESLLKLVGGSDMPKQPAAAPSTNQEPEAPRDTIAAPQDGRDQPSSEQERDRPTEGDRSGASAHPDSETVDEKRPLEFLRQLSSTIPWSPAFDGLTGSRSDGEYAAVGVDGQEQGGKDYASEEDSYSSEEDSYSSEEDSYSSEEDSYGEDHYDDGVSTEGEEEVGGDDYAEDRYGGGGGTEEEVRFVSGEEDHAEDRSAGGRAEAEDEEDDYADEEDDYADEEDDYADEEDDYADEEDDYAEDRHVGSGHAEEEAGGEDDYASEEDDDEKRDRRGDAGVVGYGEETSDSQGRSGAAVGGARVDPRLDSSVGARGRILGDLAAMAFGSMRVDSPVFGTLGSDISAARPIALDRVRSVRVRHSAADLDTDLLTISRPRSTSHRDGSSGDEPMPELPVKPTLGRCATFAVGLLLGSLLTFLAVHLWPREAGQWERDTLSAMVDATGGLESRQAETDEQLKRLGAWPGELERESKKLVSLRKQVDRQRDQMNAEMEKLRRTVQRLQEGFNHRLAKMHQVVVALDHSSQTNELNSKLEASAESVNRLRDGRPRSSSR